MSAPTWQVGDRVKMRDPDCYVQSLRRLGQRPGTVESIFTPQGATRLVVRVRFDAGRRGVQGAVEFFGPDDLVPA